MSPKITLQDVADDAGVSKSTVSLVLSNHPRISEPTRQRVLASMKKLGYVYNLRAASLRTNRSYTVGLIVTSLANPFYAELVSGIEGEFTQAGYSVLLGSTNDDDVQQDRLITTMRERDVDGSILVAAQRTSPDTLRALVQQIPTVLVSRYVEGAEVDYVGIDNEIGARRATEHLARQGHTRIAFIGGPEHSSARTDRLRGYESILHNFDLPLDPALIIPSPVSREGGYSTVQALLALPDPPTAALCYNDVVAFGVMLGLRSQGVEPGRDFAVIGFDDVAEAALWSPPLTTIAAMPARIGAEAAQQLLARIADRDAPPQEIIMPSRLVIRASSQFEI